MKKNNFFIYMLSFMSGFLCLSLEVFWIRTVSFIGMTLPQAFSFTLSVFLLGIAFGALLGKKICSEAKVNTTSVGKIYIVSSVVDIAILYALFNLPENPYILFLAGGLILISSTIRGMVFPIIHHIGTESNKSGRAISNVYFSNVFGSALAPIIVGFVAFDYLSTQQVYIIICALTLLVATLTVSNYILGGITFLALAATSASAAYMPEKLIHHLASNSYQPNVKPSIVIENKHGIVTGYKNIKPGFENDILIYGNNAYDGRLNTSIFADTNAVSRAYMLASMRTDLDSVLVVGLSTGAWTKSLLQNPNIKKITIVEINPAYLKLIETHPELSAILKDKRVQVIVDDGRKWISKNQNQKFDLVMMNNSFHWRAYSTNLVSLEFHKLVQGVLKDKGILYYNTTGSSDIYATAKKSFKHVYQHRNMVMVSNKPINIDRHVIEANLCDMREPSGGKRIFNTPFECHLASHLALKDSVIDLSSNNPNNLVSTSFELITDNNLRPEYHTIYSSLFIDRMYD